jgi:hypothetical protein
MASSGNFATWNAAAPNKSDIAFSSGNCGVTSGSGAYRALSTFVIPTNSGKWYVEVCMTSNSGNTSYVGIVSEKSPDLNADGTSFNFGRSSGDKTVYFDITVGNIITENSNSQTGLSTFSSNDDIIAMVLDMDNDTVQFYGNNSALGSAQAFPDTGDNYYIWCGGNNDKVCHINAGQDSTFGGAISAGGNADANGFGDFKYSVPTDAKGITTANLPISDDIDPAQTDDDYPGKLMSTSNWSGSGGSKSITGLGFQPDLTLIKAADAASSDWALFDSTRGVQKLLEPNTTADEETNSNSLTAFGTDGFTVGSDSRVNDSGRLMTAQSWRANGGTTASNTSGDINSTTQANTNGGFSITTYTGNGSVAQSIGHGLSSGAPEFILVKNRSQADAWAVYHVGIGNSAHLILDTTAAETTSSAYWGSFTPTTTLFKVGSDHKLNASSENYVAYLWHGVEGYSKFGVYTGNGNADGPFIYTGHMPRCVWIKRTDSSAEWAVYFWNDTSVNSSYVSLKQNPLDSRLTFDAGSMNNGEPVDFLSNGFKIKDSDAIVNASSGNYLYCSWGSVPFKYNNTF